MRDRDDEIRNNNPMNIFKVSVFMGGREMYLPEAEKKGMVKG